MLTAQAPQPSAPLEIASRLPLVYFDHGYDAGYKQAITDLQQALIPLSEHFIDTQPTRSEELRKLLYSFENFLEQRISKMSPDGAFVEGGLGI